MAKKTHYSDVYADFRIKVYGKINGRTVNQLVGIPWLIRNIGNVLLRKVLEKGYDSDLDSVTIRLRRGIKITLYPR